MKIDRFRVVDCGGFAEAIAGDSGRCCRACADGIIRKTRMYLGIEIIDMVVNVDHVHRFVK